MSPIRKIEASLAEILEVYGRYRSKIDILRDDGLGTGFLQVFSKDRF